MFHRATRAECPDVVVTTYSTGTDFLENLRSLMDFEHPDLILLDLSMPLLNGFAVAESVRSNGQSRATPIILLTALEQSEIVNETYRQGINAFVAKPFSYQEMKQLAKDLCEYWLNLGQLPQRM
ncbi:hypothetical protein GCM10027347_11610 [Larkinella harenae]